MAELTGMDSGNNALDDTVQGFEGTVHGEFYGPAAEEMGAVVSAESAAHNRILIGRIESRATESARRSAACASRCRWGSIATSPQCTSELTDTATVTAIEDDGAGGFRVTYQRRRHCRSEGAPGGERLRK